MKTLLIPNLFKASSLLLALLFTLFAVVIVWLISQHDPALNTLGLWLLYGAWLVLCNCLILSLARAWIARQPLIIGVFSVLLIAVMAVLLVELTISLSMNSWQMGYFDWPRAQRIIIASTLFALLLIRFFMLLGTLDTRSKAEAEARIQALQLRIQPHFLFNSLNTISELTAIEPKQAEQAIHSLSMLFRASLENNRKRHSLDNEITLCQRYLELERWRLGERLDLQLNVQVEQAHVWRIPKLILQPLIENAIVHGVKEDGTVQVVIDIRETGRDLSLKVENSKGASLVPSNGHGMALDNIRERLFVLYDDQYALRVTDSKALYRVILRIPKHKSRNNEERV